MPGSINLEQFRHMFDDDSDYSNFASSVIAACNNGFTPLYVGGNHVGYMISPRELQRLQRDNEVPRAQVPSAYDHDQ